MRWSTLAAIAISLTVLLARTAAASVQSLNYGGAQFDLPRDCNSDSAAQKGSAIDDAKIASASIPAAHALRAARFVPQPQSVFSS